MASSTGIVSRSSLSGVRVLTPRFTSARSGRLAPCIVAAHKAQDDQKDYKPKGSAWAALTIISTLAGAHLAFSPVSVLAAQPVIGNFAESSSDLINELEEEEVPAIEEQIGALAKSGPEGAEEAKADEAELEAVEKEITQIVEEEGKTPESQLKLDVSGIQDQLNSLKSLFGGGK